MRNCRQEDTSDPRLKAFQASFKQPLTNSLDCD
jgi:hypothetical protein